MPASPSVIYIQLCANFKDVLPSPMPYLHQMYENPRCSHCIIPEKQAQVREENLTDVATCCF